MNKILASLFVLGLSVNCRTRRVEQESAPTQLVSQTEHSETTKPPPLKPEAHLQEETTPPTTENITNPEKTQSSPQTTPVSQNDEKTFLKGVVHVRSEKAQSKNPSILLGHGDSFSLGSGVLFENPQRLLVPKSLAGKRRTLQVVDKEGGNSIFEAVDSTNKQSISVFMGTSSSARLLNEDDLQPNTTFKAGDAVTVYAKPTNQNKFAIVQSTIVYEDVKNPLDTNEKLFAIDTTLCDVVAGGLVLDSKRQLLGLVSQKSQHLCLVVPLSKKQFPTLAKSFETPVKAWLGIELASLQEQAEGKPENFDYRHGAVVKTIFPKSPAEHAGMLQGDIILSLDQEKVTLETITKLFESTQVGKQLETVIWRNGETITMQLMPIEKP